MNIKMKNGLDVLNNLLKHKFKFNVGNVGIRQKICQLTKEIT